MIEKILVSSAEQILEQYFDFDEHRETYHCLCDMIHAFRPLFDHCPSNHEFEDVLREAGVITEGMNTDTESGAFCIIFRNREAAVRFCGELKMFAAWCHANQYKYRPQYFAEGYKSLTVKKPI